MNNSDNSDLGALVSRVVLLEKRTERLEKLATLPEFADLQGALAPGTATISRSVTDLPSASAPTAVVEVPGGPQARGRFDSIDFKLPGERRAALPAEPVCCVKARSESDKPAEPEAVLPFTTKANMSCELAGGPLQIQNAVAMPAPYLMVKGENAKVAEAEDLLESPKQSQTLEARIGLYWLSKLGIGFLVVGVALLIMYTFENFGPEAKVATGFVVASLLLAIGEYLERRDNIPWYARLLEGGSWALGYFTTYAMHHVASVRLIADPLTDLVLLLGVSGLAISHAINKRSEMMAIFAVTLGFLTLGLSHVTAFSAVASAILVFVAALLSVRRRWYQLYLYSVFASYGALIVSGALQPSAVSDLQESFKLTTLLLGPALVGFGLVPALVPESNKLSKPSVEIGTVVNVGAFCSLFFPAAYSCMGPAASIYNLTIALWLFALAALARHNGAPITARINSLFALTIGTFYFPGSHYGRASWLYLAGEVALLAWAGLRFNLKSFRWFATALSVVLFLGNIGLLFSAGTILLFGHYLPFCLCSAASAVLAMSFVTFLQRHKPLLENASLRERQIVFYTHFNLAVMLAWSLPLALIGLNFEHIGAMADEMQMPAVLYAWTALSAAVMYFAIRLRNNYMQVMTIILFALCGLPACAGLHFSWFVSAPAVAVMFAAAFVFRHYADRLSQTKSMANFQTQFLSAYICAALLPIGAHLTSDQTAVYLALQAFIALALGIRLPNKFVRLIAPVAFGYVVISSSAHILSWTAMASVVVCLYAAWALYRLPIKFDADQSERDLRHVYSVLAAIVMTVFFALKLGENCISLSWAVEALALVVVGFAAREKTMRLTGLSLCCALIFRLLCIDLNHDLDSAFIAPIITSMYLAWAIYKAPANLAERAGIEKSESDLRHIYSVAAGVVLTCFLGMKLEKTWISCAWALEGFAMLALGFALREKVMRISGLVVFASLVYRLLFIDLASAETVYRICAFIVAGLVLLLSAYAYTWFAKKFGAEGDFEVELPANALPGAAAASATE
jgi:hypothetical protein